MDLIGALRSVNGVATIGELRVLYSGLSEAGVLKLLQRERGKGSLIKVKAGLYALPDAPLDAISFKINQESYISTGTVLAKALLIGSVPARRIQAVKVGRPRVYASPLGTIEHLSIHPRLFFGYSLVDGLYEASPEKAFLDACYYAYKGKTMSFDLDADVDRDALDHALLESYLKRYDKRFLTYYGRLVT